jgi:hypothetical protein
VPKLKVFCTAIGFHDAYVGTPSKKAALKAWGTTKDLFARGAAEIVTDPKLTKEPLASPGEVFKLSRGSAAEQMAALPKDEAAPPRRTKPPAMSKLKVAVEPRPDRAALNEAENAVDEAQARQQRETDGLNAQIARLEKQRRQLSATQAREREKLEKIRLAEETRYRRAMEKWRSE